MRQASGVSLLLLAAVLPAQAFTSPRGHETQECFGPAATTQHPFYAAVARFQYVDGTQRGTPRSGISALELRRDGETPPGVHPARKITKLTLLLAHADLGRIGTWMPSNYLGQPTSVVSAQKLDLPALDAAPSVPAPWSIVIPFQSSTTFSYDGVSDLLFEFQCEQDPLTADQKYCLEAANDTPAGQGAVSYLDTSLLGSCQTVFGNFWQVVPLPQTSAAGLVTLRTVGSGGPASSTGVWALGLSDPKLTGIFCAPLRTSAELLLPATSNALGQVGAGTAPLALSFAYPGPLTLYSQLALLDGGGLKLSDACALRVVGPGAIRPLRRISATNASGTAATLFLGTVSPLLCLVVRLR